MGTVHLINEPTIYRGESGHSSAWVRVGTSQEDSLTVFLGLEKTSDGWVAFPLDHDEVNFLQYSGYTIKAERTSGQPTRNDAVLAFTELLERDNDISRDR